jgi:EmrB/QacA subfamily drug resistance transporter
MGVWGSVVALGAVLGPIVGGWLVTNYAWEWVFLINVPVGIAAILATLAIVPESIDPFASGRVDWGGILLSGLGTFALVYAAIEGNHFGWTSPIILGSFAACIVLLALFVWWEARADDPMMKLELFAIRNFSVANILGLATSFGMLGVFFPMTVFLQGALGLSPLEAGLAMLPNGLVLMFVAPTAGRLSDKIGARWILVTGLSLMAVGIVAMIRQISPDATQWSFILPLAITGVGMGMTFAPMTATAMRQVPPRIAGSASGILNTTRNLGQVLGIAVLGSILQSRLGVHAAETLSQVSNLDPDVGSTLGDLIAAGRVEAIPAALPPGSETLLPLILGSVRQAFALSMHETFAIGAITCLLGAGVALLIQNPKPGTVPSRQARAETVAHAVAAD